MANSSTHNRNTQRFQNFELDQTQGILRKNGRVLKMRNQTYELLCYFVNHPNQIIHRTKLAEHLWGSSEIDFNQRLNAAIRDLRKVLDEDGNNRKMIITLPRKGYRFVIAAETPPSMKGTSTSQNTFRWITAALLLTIGAAWFFNQAPASSINIPKQTRDKYIVVRALLDTQDPQHYASVQASLEQILADVPRYSDAWASLANLHLCKVALPRETLPLAKKAAAHALEINPNHVEALRHSATVAISWDRDWHQAEKYLKRAVNTSPGDARVYQAYAALLYLRGDLVSGEAMLQKGLAIDPLSLVLNSDLAWYQTVSGDYERALETCTLIAKIKGEPERTTTCALGPNLLLGRIREAADIARSEIEKQGGLSIIADMNDNEVLKFFWQKNLESQTNAERTGYIDPVNIALMHAKLGDPDSTLLELERAVSERSDFAPYIHLFPEFRALHSQTRFIQLLESIGLPEKPHTILGRLRASSTPN